MAAPEEPDITQEQTEKLLQFQDLTVNTAEHRLYSYAVARPQPRGLPGWGYYLIMLPFRFTYTILDIFRFAPRSWVTDPVGDIVAFMLSFEEKYGRAHPAFYREFLLQHTLGPEVISLINTRMFHWACSANKPEGYRVLQGLGGNTYPFLALIMLKDQRTTAVGPNDLINQLTCIMDANQTYLTQVLRQQKDKAYLASLRADQEKERKTREEPELKGRKEEEEVQQQKLAEERGARNLQEEKQGKLECLPPEPSPDDPESVKIIFKLANDSRFQIEANFPRWVLPCIPSEEWPNTPTLQEARLSHTEVLCSGPER
ncbi:unnamed protein product [Nyctereutes procyonoides]|uniref:(raccoon dog) hypothetical protein n=1 Tax=Nyctereutes procyonoides TaxID=34880 RepID=A0A811YB48_NYCPR|nr:unnamed protein product [Nyctereutes procyonoides]